MLTPTTTEKVYGDEEPIIEYSTFGLVGEETLEDATEELPELTANTDAASYVSEYICQDSSFKAKLYDGLYRWHSHDRKGCSDNHLGPNSTDTIRRRQDDTECILILFIAGDIRIRQY